MSRIATILAETTHAPEQTFKETRPMESVSTDLFSHAGKDYLVLIDRYWDYVFCSDALLKINCPH